jgi:hypothetical protein
MKCIECPFYVWDINYNYCKRFGFEYYKVFENCVLINDDGSDNIEQIKQNDECLP